MSAFKAGFINSAGLLATGKYVSHVTGFGTQIGLAVGHEDFFFGAELLVIPFSFIAGGVLTSYLLDRNYKAHELPSFHYIQALITLLIGAVILIGESSSAFSQRFNLDNNYNLIEFLMIGLLCFICGLKNSLVTWATYGKIRVTHLTGLSTDIGLNLIRTFNPNQPAPRFKEDKIVNITRITTFFFFSTGACISAMAFPRLGYKSFFVVFLFSAIMTVISVHDYLKHKEALASSLPEPSYK